MLAQASIIERRSSFIVFRVPIGAGRQQDPAEPDPVIGFGIVVGMVLHLADVVGRPEVEQLSANLLSAGKHVVERGPAVRVGQVRIRLG